MSQATTTKTELSIPTIDSADPVKMLTWPRSLTSLVSSLDYTTNTLPATCSITQSDREAMIRRATEIDRASSAREPQAGATITREVLSLLLAFPGRDPDVATAKIRAGAFATALDDLPAWAVREAAQRWMRGECGNDGKWAPTPPQLRTAAVGIIKAAQGMAAMLRRVATAAIAPAPPTDAEAAEMASRSNAVLDSILRARA